MLGLAAVVAGAVMWARRRWTAVTVRGDSMEPTLSEGDRVLVRRCRIGGLATGDIVVSWVPGMPRTRTPNPADRPWLIKRVAALPGDPVPDSVSAAVGGDEQVPPERLILLGDQPEASIDSRSLGYVPGGHVLGVVIRRLP